jgi:2-dehydro-3-deoxyphosphogluconate aldolase/(4S)-4-hydroxy-2-oxoglutarate aldolase
MLVGAGTVLTPGQAEAAAAAGARFIVSPGFSSSVARRCAELGVPYVPGVATATEVMSALSEGLAVLKFFPAEAIGGVACLRAISAPFGDVAWLPTGGIESTNAPAYLSVPGVIAVGGSWMVRPDLVDAGRFDQVEALAREAAAIAPPAETGLSAR